MEPANMINYKGNGSNVTREGIIAAAAKAGIEPRALKAVTLVETRGRAWDSQGRVAMLFEPHVFFKALKDVSEGALATAVNQGLAYRHQGEKPYPKDSYPRFLMACAIDLTAACASASWGAAQIMGENFESAGYASPQAMIEAFAGSADEQINGMAEFIKTEGLNVYLAREDWATYARLYNGKGYAKNHYDTNLRDAYEHLAGGEYDIPPARIPVDGPHEDALREVPLPPRRPADLGHDAAVTYLNNTATTSQDNSPKVAADARPFPDSVWPHDKAFSPADDDAAAMAAKLAPADMAMTTDTPPVPYNVKDIQTRLRSKGYFDTLADGDLGHRTERAILAFRNEHGLPLVATVDAAFLVALAGAQPNPPPASRTAATAKSMRSISKTIQATGRQKLGSAGIAISGFFTTAVSAIGGNMDGASSMLAPVRDAFEGVPGYVYGAAVCFVALLIYLQAHSVEQAKVSAFKEGRSN